MSALVTLWGLLAGAFTWVTCFRLWRARRVVRSVALAPKVLLLRPVDAPTAAELANLSAPIDYPGPLEQVVLAPFALPLEGSAQWLFSNPPTANRKVGHLNYALAILPHQDRIVISIDADVRVSGELLQALVAPILGGAALCSAPLAPQPGRGPGAVATRSLLLHTHHSFVALDAARAGAPAVCGKALAFGRPALELLSELGNHAGEDLELSARLERAGQRIALAEVAAPIPQPDPISLRPALDRFTRWMSVLRAHRPALYPSVPLLFAPSLPLLLLAFAAASPIAAGAVAFAWVSRAALSWQLARRSGTSPAASDLVAWLPGEALLLAAFARSLSSRAVTWRGQQFVLEAGGLMTPLALRDSQG